MMETAEAAAGATSDAELGHGMELVTGQDQGNLGEAITADAAPRPLRIASKREMESRTITVRDLVALLERDPMYKSSTLLTK